MFSAAVDTLIESGRIMRRSIALEIRNGFSCWESGDYTWIPVIDYSIDVKEGIPTIGSMRGRVAITDFEYFDEFDHTYYDPGNPVMLYAEVRLLCTIYLDTGTALGGTISTTAGSRTVTGAGTAFLADFQPGDMLYIDAYPEIRLMVWQVVNNTTLTTYEIAPDSNAGAAYSRVDAEREYIFRGFITDREIVDKSLLIESFDWLEKLQKSAVQISMEADLYPGSPFANALLREEPFLAPGDHIIYEIDPTVPGQAWAEDAAGLNRVFVPAAYEVEEFVGAAWVPIGADEYQIIESLGLVEFKQDRGVGAQFRIVSVSVYQEGTLELEDVYEAVLTADSTTDFTDCMNIAPGFDDTTWREALTGNFTMTNGATGVVGVGCAFDTELSQGDRIAHNATPGTYGIVDIIAGPNNLTLRYPYPGATAGPLPGYKSTLRASFLSLTRIKWDYCDGTVADLMRLLQRNYADVRGYRIWYDYMDDVVRGDRIQIDEPGARELSLIGSLKTHLTTENFNSAILVTGTLDRATNLMSDAGMVLTLDAEIAGWFPGVSKGGTTSWGNMTWSVAPGADAGLYDSDIENAYPVYFIFPNGIAAIAAESTWYDYVTIDLGQSWDLSDIIIYNINCKNSNNFKQGVWLQYSTDGINFYDILTAYQLELDPDERRDIDASDYTARYIRIKCRPFKWPSGTSWAGTRIRTLGLREIIIFGTEQICELVCVQNTDAAGGRTVGGVFISDFYPDIIKKLGCVGHQTMLDNSGLILSNEEAIDRGYLLLNEYIRLYREISHTSGFDPRVQIYDSVHTQDVYRETGTDELYYLVESYTITDRETIISGREYGAGPLAETTS